jgi:glutamyl-tRNA synthetase
MGYLPAAMRNYLVRLGWSHGDQEIFSAEEMIGLFDLPQIGRSPARFDFAKLESLNGHYLRHLADAEVIAELERALPHLAGGETLTHKQTPALRAKLVAAMPGLKERAKTLIELLDAASYIYADRPIAIDPKAAALLTASARALLASLTALLAGLNAWDPENLEAAVRGFAERQGLKLGTVAQPLLTGRTTSAGICDVLLVLGKSETLARLADLDLAGAGEQANERRG